MWVTLRKMAASFGLALKDRKSFIDRLKIGGTPEL
jgi:hypothetical protein